MTGFSHRQASRSLLLQLGWLSIVIALATGSFSERAEAQPGPAEIVVVASGDDDGDGVADRDDDDVTLSLSGLDLSQGAKRPSAFENQVDGAALALFSGTRRLAKGPVENALGPFRLQAREPGRHEVDIFGVHHTVGALLVTAFDGRGRTVDLAKSHASIERTPPRASALDKMGGSDEIATDDSDAIRFVVSGFIDDLPSALSLTSTATIPETYRSPTPFPAASLDSLRSVSLTKAPCPKGVSDEISCVTTPFIRTVMDDLDRQHPLTVARSIKVELGGLLEIALGTRPAELYMRVGGPRDTAFGAIDRLRASLRVRLVRLGKGGPPPVGENDHDALDRVRDEIDRANMIWGACGVSFGPRQSFDVKVIDPPPPFLLAVGCDVGAIASGGVVQFDADQKHIEAHIAPGTSPKGAARVISLALEKAGFRPTVSDNAAIAAATYGTSDILVHRQSGELATLTRQKPKKGEAAPSLSTDLTLPVCIGRVDLDDGLSHFTDANAIAGTLEERTLVKAFDDGDPATIEVYVVPSFGGDSRIGESFIFADAGSIKDVVVEDRGGFRADRASFTLAHELGHVLLDQPGHPDDFGVDTPTRLMDADAVNASAFGPRRLEVAECERMVRQSGPASLPRLLTLWPTEPHPHLKTK